MKFLLSQLSIAVLSVAFMLYLVSIEYFTPLNAQGDLNWYGVLTVLFLVVMFVQSFVSLIIYLTQKFLAYGWKEFPNPIPALKWGIGLALSSSAVLILNAFHILNLQWGLIAILLVIVAIVII